MRLTNAMRDAFIRSVMNDVPKVDYEDQMRKHAIESLERVMPFEVLTTWRKYPDWINTEWRNVGEVKYMTVPMSHSSILHISQTDALKMKELDKLKDAQERQHGELRDKLHAAAYACSTNAKLLELLPEFEKYIPKDGATASRSLPAVQNMIADFVKAGWPKQQTASTI